MLVKEVPARESGRLFLERRPPPAWCRSAPGCIASPIVPRLVTAREAFDDISRSVLNGGSPVRHAALLVADLDEFDALVKQAGTRVSHGIASRVGRLLVSPLRGGALVPVQPPGRFPTLLPA